MKPDINDLGLFHTLSVHEKALRDAQDTIDKLRARVRELEAIIDGGTIHFPSPPQPQRVVVAPQEHMI